MDILNTIVNFLGFLGTYVGFIIQLRIHLRNK